MLSPSGATAGPIPSSPRKPGRCDNCHPHTGPNRDGDWFRAGANAALSFVLCLVAVWLGHLIATSLNSSKGL